MKWKDILLSLLYPAVCPCCGERSPGAELCGVCRRKWAEETFLRCPACGKGADRCLCGTDFTSSLPDELAGRRFLSLTWYIPAREEAADRVTEKMILSLKSTGSLAEFFAGECAREIRRLMEKAEEDPADWVLSWCPRSPEKFMETGFDQGEEVCRPLSKLLGCRCASLLSRTTGSAAQKELNAEERQQNAQDSLFPRTSKIHPGMKILLFDDIITTGASIKAAVSVLLRGGAARVFPFSIARTFSPGPRANSCSPLSRFFTFPLHYPLDSDRLKGYNHRIIILPSNRQKRGIP